MHTNRLNKINKAADGEDYKLMRRFTYPITDVFIYCFSLTGMKKQTVSFR